MESKSILLIGGYGFLGCNILHWIDANSLQYKVTVLGRENDFATNGKFKCVKSEFLGDFTDSEFLTNALENSNFDYVFHCLSTSTPATSNTEIIQDIESNLIATIRLLDLLRSKKSKLVFFSSGGAIYGNSASVVHKVGDTPNPVSSYGVIKNCIEQYISVYNNLYGLKYINLRISNPYGFYHKSNVQGLINIAIRKAISKESIEVWGDGNNQKDYIFAQDIPAIIFPILEKDIQNITLNLGSGTGSSINSILKIIRNINQEISVRYKEHKAHDVPEFVLNIEKLSELIDLNLTPLDRGILKTYNWQKSITLSNHEHV